MHTIKGTYYDGVSSRPYKAVVTVNNLYLKIDFPEDGERNTVKWDHYKIHSADIPGSTKVSLNYGEYPHQSIEVDSKEFSETLKDVFPQAPYLKTPNNFFLSKSIQWLIGLAVVFIGIIVLAYYVALPLVTNLAVKAIPIETEIELGKKMAESALQEEKIDKKKTVSVNKFLAHLKINSSYPIQVTVVERDVKNAFAVPGGQLVIYTALLNEMDNYSELVALLGHEIAHVEERHTLKMLVKSMGLYLLASAVLQDVGGIMAVLIDNASALERLSYNRNLESEADERGLEIVLANQVDPKGMIDLFNHLKGDNEVDITPEFLMTHPSLDKRIEVLQQKLPKLDYKVVQNDSLSYYWRRLQEK